MLKKISVILAAAIIIGSGVALAGGLEVTSNDLINHAGEYDGQEVVYTGEVIGDILYRDDYAWINVSDGSNAIGIWADTDDIEQLEFVGGYTVHGDTVKITGVFNRACAEHGGDFDIHAGNIEVVEKGHLVSHTAQAWKIILAAVLLAGAAVMVPLILRKKARS